jgi:glycosyltransferase involved in cell wall biosynthesis
MTEKLRILASPSNPGAIGKLRIVEPCAALADVDLATVTIFESEKQCNLQDYMNVVQKSDIIWYQAVMNQMFMWNILNTRRFNPNVKLIVDVDDNLYSVNPWNPSYESFTQDEEVDLGNTVYKLPRKRNHARLRMFETLLMESDAIVTTTSLLAARYAHLNKNIYIMPNRLKWEAWNIPHIPWRNDGKIRIAWSGGSSHKMDWVECHAACKRIINKYDNVFMEFQTSPMCYQEFLRDFGPEKVILHDWIDYTGHAYRMNCFKPEIAVVPLHEDEFSVCKSELKYLEYAALKVPCVCSNLAPYAPVIKHGETGFLANDDMEFEKYIDILIHDADLRKRMGGAAFKWAEENRNLEKNINETKEMLDDIMALPHWHIAKSDEKVLVGA